MSARKPKPIRVFYSVLSQRFYATRAYRGDANGNVTVTGEKFDVTNDIAGLIEQHGVTFQAAPVVKESLTTADPLPDADATCKQTLQAQPSPTMATIEQSSIVPPNVPLTDDDLMELERDLSGLVDRGIRSFPVSCVEMKKLLDTIIGYRAAALPTPTAGGDNHG